MLVRWSSTFSTSGGSDRFSNHSMKSYRNIDSELPAATRGAGGLPHWAPNRLPPGFSLTTYRWPAFPTRSDATESRAAGRSSRCTTL